MFKRNDIILIVSMFLVCSLLSIFAFGGGDQAKIKVTVNGKEYGTYDISTPQRHTIKTEHGTNTLVIENNEAYFKNSNCFDKTCENMGKIKNVGESIVCLPHRVIAEVVE